MSTLVISNQPYKPTGNKEWVRATDLQGNELFIKVLQVQGKQVRIMFKEVDGSAIKFSVNRVLETSKNVFERVN